MRSLPHNSACMMLVYLPAGLLVLHAHAPDPTAGFSALFQAAELPPLMKQGVMDPLILKHYLLLHDDQGQPNGLSRYSLAWTPESSHSAFLFTAQ